MHLVESTGKKAAYLREAVNLVGAPATVHAMRVEDFTKAPPGPIEVVTARALAPLRKLLTLANPLLKNGSVGLFPKGQDVEAELTEAAKYWNIKASLAFSRTDPKARIVCVRGLEPTLGPASG